MALVEAVGCLPIDVSGGYHRSLNPVRRGLVQNRIHQLVTHSTAPMIGVNEKLLDFQIPLSLRFETGAVSGLDDPRYISHNDAVPLRDPEVAVLKPLIRAIITLPKRRISTRATFLRPKRR